VVIADMSTVKMRIHTDTTGHAPGGPFSAHSVSTVSMPDFAAQERAHAANREMVNDLKQESVTLKSVELKANTVFPGQSVSAACFFVFHLGMKSILNLQ